MPCEERRGARASVARLGLIAGVCSLLASGCGLQAGTFCDELAPPSCYDVDFAKGEITIVFPNSDKRLGMALIKKGDKTYYFLNPLGEDKGDVIVTLIDDDTIGVKNENNEGEPVIHHRKK